MNRNENEEVVEALRSTIKVLADAVTKMTEERVERFLVPEEGDDET